MNKRTLTRSTAFLALGMFCMSSSCKKPEEVSNNIQKPVLSINTLTKDVKAGDLVDIDMNVQAVNNTSHFKVEAEYNGGGKTLLLDSTLNPAKGYFTRVFHYQIPDDARKGDKAVLTFTATDEKNISSEKTETITVTGSRPQMTVTPSKTTAAAGEAIQFTVHIMSVEANLTSLQIKEGPSGVAGSVVKDTSFSNVDEVNYNFPFTISSSIPSGTNDVFTFVATNSEGTQKLVVSKIQVQ